VSEARASLLADGRLHLQHGPIDCLCRAEGEAGEIAAAYAQAQAAFPAILPALAAELPHLRAPLPTPSPKGAIARAMHAACMPFAAGFITPMAAVAGAVADAVLATMIEGRTLTRAFVNNGGDIAFHLAPGATLRAGLVADLAAPALDGVFLLEADLPARGLATSGRACKGAGGKSFSLGIADATSVLARNAAAADAAATMIGNAVDLPGHPAIRRRPACEIDAASDLDERLVTVALGDLAPAEIRAALDAGRQFAEALHRAGLIAGAVLALRGVIATVLPARQDTIPFLEVA
jgi:ApbE superfamily uncharacterized protein (UPF0280 family)